MKFIILIVLSLFLVLGCSKSAHTIQQGTAPNTSAGKDGSDTGAGPTGSLGSENPSTPNTTH